MAHAGMIYRRPTNAALFLGLALTGVIATLTSAHLTSAQQTAHAANSSAQPVRKRFALQRLAGCEAFREDLGGLRPPTVRFGSRGPDLEMDSTLSIEAEVDVVADSSGRAAAYEIEIQRETFERVRDSEAARAAVSAETLQQSKLAGSLSASQRQATLEGITHWSILMNAWINGVRCKETERYYLYPATTGSNAQRSPLHGGLMRTIVGARTLSCEIAEISPSGRMTWRIAEGPTLNAIRDRMKLELSRSLLNPVEPELALDPKLPPIGFEIDRPEPNTLELFFITSRDPTNRCGALRDDRKRDIRLVFAETR